MKKKSWITWIIILAVVLLAIFILNKSPNETTEEIAKCIGENSELYIQLGCHACETQEDMFGENYQYLTTIDCFYERDKCMDKEIQGTPTWIIDEQEYLGVLSLEELKTLTGC